MSILSMHWAEYPWKNELQLQAERVLKHMAEALDEDFHEEHSPMDMLERAIALAAFSMRRMIEKRLVTDALTACTVNVQSFPAKIEGFRPPFHGASGGRAYANYHFDKPEVLSLKVKSLADEIIHSSQLMLIAGDGQVADGLLIASDWHLKKRLLHLTPADFIRLVRAVLDDRITSLSESWNPGSGVVTSRRD
jgi:hypothetical protein